MVSKSRAVPTPDAERHGKIWQLVPLWFLGNFQYSMIAIGFRADSSGRGGRLPQGQAHPERPGGGGAVTTVVYLLLARTVDDAAEQAAIEKSGSEMQTVSSQAGT